jgi:hypothetical protein
MSENHATTSDLPSATTHERARLHENPTVPCQLQFTGKHYKYISLQPLRKFVVRHWVIMPGNSTENARRCAGILFREPGGGEREE